MPSDIEISGSRSNAIKTFLLWAVIASISFAAFKTLSPDNGSISQVEIRQRILTAVENGANLEIVKRVYENRKILNQSIFFFWR
jgi:hypothetical protein